MALLGANYTELERVFLMNFELIRSTLAISALKKEAENAGEADNASQRLLERYLMDFMGLQSSFRVQKESSQSQVAPEKQPPIGFKPVMRASNERNMNLGGCFLESSNFGGVSAEERKTMTTIGEENNHPHEEVMRTVEHSFERQSRELLQPTTQSITQVSTAVCSPGEMSPGLLADSSQPIENQESRILRTILEHNRSLTGFERKQNAKKQMKLVESLTESLEALGIPEETGIRSKIISLLEPLVPNLSELFKSKSFDVILASLIVFVCKWKGYPKTPREIVVKLGSKEKMVNRCLSKLREIYPRESNSHLDPKNFIYRVVGDMCLRFNEEKSELIRVSEQILGNLCRIRLMTNEHSLTVACFCVYLACLVKKNDYEDMKKISEVANISKGTLLNIYRKYYPFRQWLLIGVEGGNHELLRDF